MEKTENNNFKNHKEIFTREYLHSISRIGDRLKILERDISKQKQELVYMEEDVRLLSSAFDSLFADLMENFEKKLNKEIKNEKI